MSTSALPSCVTPMPCEAAPRHEVTGPFALGVGLFGLDIAAYAGGVTGALPPAVAISAHLLAVAIALRAAFLARRSSRFGMTVQLAVWLLLAGAFGVAIWLAAHVTQRSTSDEDRKSVV